MPPPTRGVQQVDAVLSDVDDDRSESNRLQYKNFEREACEAFLATGRSSPDLLIFSGRFFKIRSGCHWELIAAGAQQFMRETIGSSLPNPGNRSRGP
jgi:hypothetical protein